MRKQSSEIWSGSYFINTCFKKRYRKLHLKDFFRIMPHRATNRKHSLIFFRGTYQIVLQTYLNDTNIRAYLYFI